MANLLARGGKLLTNGTNLIATSNPSGCRCCTPPPDVGCMLCGASPSTLTAVVRIPPLVDQFGGCCDCTHFGKDWVLPFSIQFPTTNCQWNYQNGNSGDCNNCATLGEGVGLTVQWGGSVTSVQISVRAGGGPFTGFGVDYETSFPYELTCGILNLTIPMFDGGGPGGTGRCYSDGTAATLVSIM